MKVRQAGFHRVVALMGCMLSESQAGLIIRAVSTNGRLLLLFDEDQAGQLARIKVRERLARSLKVKGVPLPQPGLQPDALSPAQLRELLSW